jgi:hypothetical protein
MSRLRELSIGKVAPHIMDQIIEQVRRMPQMRRLRLIGDQGTREMVAQRLPGLLVEFLSADEIDATLGGRLRK